MADDGPAAAARPAAALFLLAGVLALAGMASPHSRAHDLAIIAGADFAIAAFAWLAPWDRLGRYGTLVLLAVPGLAVLAFSTLAVGGFASGTGPFFVLLYAWIGLHHSAPAIVALTPITATAYVWPLVATHQPPEVIASAVVFVPVTTAVGIVISRRVARLHRALAQVEAAERWRAALVATLAHDVRTPLTAVHGALCVLAEDDVDEATRVSFLALALRQTDRMARLAGGLLDVERVEHGLLRLDVRDVDLRHAVSEAAQYVPGAPVEIDVGNVPRIQADPERLEQILVNLIANAARHGRPPIVVTAESAGAQVRITVRDHGPGVPEAEAASLFTRFTSDDPTGRSVGLGLWIVRQLAEAHGGTAHYESARPGAGFVITLPTVDASDVRAVSTTRSGQIA